MNYKALREAADILEAVWIEVGPYNHNKLSEETMRRLRRFFNFDNLEKAMTTEEAIRLGFAYALYQYGIWKDGSQRIDCMERPIKDVLQEFDQSGKAKQLANQKSQDRYYDPYCPDDSDSYWGTM